MGTILTFTAPCGAAVAFTDNAYKNANEAELAQRRENMLGTAEQLALSQLRQQQPHERKPP